MNKIVSNYFAKLFVKQWVIGITSCDIKDIIRSKKFNPDINWLQINNLEHFQADPFPLILSDNKISIFYEDFKFDDFYGKISMMSLDKNLKKIENEKVILDTKSHLSYPFIFKENNKIYVFPEAAHSGKLSCYKYNKINNSLEFHKDILNLPLLDSTILKHDDIYWLFGNQKGEFSNDKLYIYFSDKLLGPYSPHPLNPVKSAPDGSRPAGNIFEVDGMLYRPSQNCKEKYGESITINKLIKLNKSDFSEEPYMVIRINNKNKNNKGIRRIHTINSVDNIIIVDGLKWIFSPKNQLKNFLRNRAYSRQQDNQVIEI